MTINNNSNFSALHTRHRANNTKNFDVWDFIIESDKRKAGANIEVDNDGKLVIHGGSHSRAMNSVHESPQTHSRRVDSFEVSESAPDPFQERLNEIEKQRRILEQTIERVRDVREMYRLLAEGIKEQLDKQKKALEVARRIALGDNVPPHEKAYLVENSPVLYREATETRMRRDNEELRIYRRDYSPNE